MDNELDGRLRRLEARQADQAAQLLQLVGGQERIHRALPELVQLMTKPDEEAMRLYEALDSLTKVIAVNTATLRILERSLTGQSDEEPDEPH